MTQVRYLFSRGFTFVCGIAFILIVSFLVIYLLPGDPARMILGPHADAQTVEQFRETAGLNQSLLVQFERFSVRTMRLDFGDSLVQHRPVIELMKERAGFTVILILCAIAALTFFGVLLPVALLAVRQHWIDQANRTIWSVLAAAPPYVLSVASLTLFAAHLGWIPAIFSPDRMVCWVVPAMILAVYPTSLVARLFHNAIARSMDSEYAFRARAQGFSEAAILFREALINSAAAPVSAFANGLAYFVTGTFFVEVAFGIGGLGTLTYNAIRDKDVNVLAGVCLVFAFAVCAISALLDLSQHLLDPQLRRTRESAG